MGPTQAQKDEFVNLALTLPVENWTTNHLFDGKDHFCPAGWALYQKGISKERLRRSFFAYKLMEDLFGFTPGQVRTITQINDSLSSSFYGDRESILRKRLERIRDFVCQL